MADKDYYTIRDLANRLGVSAPAVHFWIKHRHVEEPVVEPISGQRVYPAAAIARIEEWYMKRCAYGATAGHGAAARRERGRAWLAAAEAESK